MQTLHACSCRQPLDFEETREILTAALFIHRCNEESGRAGRDGKPGSCILLFTKARRPEPSLLHVAGVQGLKSWESKLPYTTSL